jgi:glycosyltransferase involved in cell wall biosynthesis
MVVIGRNEGARLKSCFQSVGSSCRLVYVDSGSTDDSVAVAEESGAVVVRLDPCKQFTAARARNEGFAALMKMNPNLLFIQFIDGDCELVSGWVETAASFLRERSDVAIVCGRRRELFPKESIFNQLCDLEWDTPHGEASSAGGDFLVRVKAFKDVGGFRPEIMAGEEPELCARLRERGLKIWRISAEMTKHDIRLKHFGQWWRRLVRSGYAYAEVSSILRSSPCQVYLRETTRAIFWAGVVPVFICVSTYFYPLMLCLALIYPLQAIRIAIQSRQDGLNPGSYAFFMIIAKFAEFQGIVRFFWRRVLGKTAEPIEYKGVPETGHD